ncbi:CDF family Co(II)/Ni(II) efflux transporter DmeF [Rhizobium sp. SL42]|uniref:CDF family Co(II)/Ni(II) efflux transporter DmeF n=1 Tax=Rhizobium sp. SL42 TaxID=2806346 RepID=UPI001F0065E6|nr:CDF family Co(II)/Ni(II) efflux transporter DmeF [Rhizobium sp. SL42]UJW76773.1 CDF family Co(II)/Ni(II) efflux transporter DmeF [Rhizobium sp. SL42]
MPQGVGRLASRHAHVFLGADHDRNARRTWIVIAITATMMVAEIAGGVLFGSMALLADGWHMATHAGAILIAALAYRFARRNADNGRFTFGTGKVGDLAGFASAIVLAMVALLIGWESLSRFRAPVSINFSEAIIVASVGLVVNLVCAVLLHEGGHSHAPHDHGDHHGDHHVHHYGHDGNLRAAYVHVLADALTSVLAIAALIFGSVYGWLWLDPAIGLVGTLIIGRWAFALMRQSGSVLLDYTPRDAPLSEEIRDIIEGEGAEIADLHVWQLGPGHHGAIVSLSADAPKPPSHYREKLAALTALSHVTVEVEWHGSARLA